MSKHYSISKIIGFIAGPALFTLLLMLAQSADEGNKSMLLVLALAAWMVSWWATEAVPIPATAILPIVVLPSLGVFELSQATAPYASPIIFLFMGGFMIALGLEKHNLHERIALNLLKVTGSSGNGIILGFMIATTLLSMWISNTATAVMMLPIAISVTSLIFSNDKAHKPTTGERNFGTGLMLCIAYSANIGGSMTLIGTPPNVVMAGYLKDMMNYEMSFSRWMLIGIPAGLILLFFTYVIITKVLFRNNITEVEGSEVLVINKLKALGPFSRNERYVATIFAFTVICWVFKSQINQLIGSSFLNDTVTAMAGGILMFVTPVNFKKGEFVLTWKDTKRLPWGILLLFGGGMCLARALEHVGIIEIMGAFVEDRRHLNIMLIVLMTTALVLFLTEIMSNVALITIFIPVAIGIAGGLNVNPMMIVIPATIASSCAFMMPISTPPNAIVFSSGNIKMRQMMRAGIILNIIAIITLELITFLLVDRFF